MTIIRYHGYLRFRQGIMFKLITILLAIGAVGYAVYWIKQLRRSDEIEDMSSEELVDAIIRREISILEVPQKHRDSVDNMIDELRRELDKNRL